MNSKLRSTLGLAAGIAIAAPIFFAFQDELAALPMATRLLAAAGAVLAFALAALLIANHLNMKEKATLAAITSAVVLGTLFGLAPAAHFPSADFARINYSDGTHNEHVVPSTFGLWGRSELGYFLHPAYDSARVPNSLVADFSLHPHRVSLLFSKPPQALLQADGTSTLSDGVSLQVTALDADGKVLQSQEYDISQAEFLAKRWQTRTIDAVRGIHEIHVSVTPGPPGSTPYFDSTIVAFEVLGLHDTAVAIGNALLVGVAFLATALFAMLSLRKTDPDRHRLGIVARVRRSGPLLLLAAVILAIAWWSASRTQFIYFWDFRNYWQKTEMLYGLLVSGSLAQAISLFTQYYSGDYSMLPAVVPALLSRIAGYPTRIIYTLSIVGCYAVPAYLMVAYLAKRLVEGDTPAGSSRERNTWAYACVPVFFGLPQFFSTTLYLMPDIGGVPLFVAALLLAESLVREVTRERDGASGWAISAELLRSSIGLGIVFSLMFLFRRWYVFAVIGIGFSCLVLILDQARRDRKRLRDIALRSLASAALCLSAGLPFLCWVMFDWSRTVGAHDYANLYASYKNPLIHTWRDFAFRFGLAAPALCVMFVLFGRWLVPNRRLLFLLVASSLIAGALFLYIQSPGIHHHYLLMPLLGASLAALSILLFRSRGVLAAVSLCAVLVLGGELSTWPAHSPDWVVAVFPTYLDWLPKQQPDSKGLSEVTSWLLQPGTKDKSFCVIASSVPINQGIFGELWQTQPAVKEGEFDSRLIALAQVDSVGGPPAPAIRLCSIALVGVPFQRHLRPGEQYSLQIVQEDLLSGTGIGAAYGRSPRVFLMDGKTSILAFEQTRPITDAEYQSLVERYVRKKSSGIGNPAP